MISSEQYGDGSSNLFMLQDSVEAIASLIPAYAGKVQLIYLDPPFNTGKRFGYRARVGERGYSGDSKWTVMLDSYSDARDDNYIPMLDSILAGCHELLASDGCIYLHVDYRASAQARILLDKLFGPSNLVNEIIWSYKSGGRSKSHFARKHDTILFYRKSKQYYFNIEAVGVKRGSESKNHMKREVDENGKVVMTIKSGGKLYKYTEDSLVFPSDVWADISHLQQRDPERTGFETQKPEALLKRIILASSREGDIVADFFSGSGTTASVAHKLDRRFIACDKSPIAFHQLRKRILMQDRDMLFASYNNTLFDWQPILQPCTYPCRLQCSRSKGRAVVCFEDYCLPEHELSSVSGAQPFDYIDYWAVGTCQGERFYPYSQDFRTAYSPSLDNKLYVPDVPDLYAQVVDIFGRQQFIPL